MGGMGEFNGFISIILGILMRLKRGDLGGGGGRGGWRGGADYFREGVGIRLRMES